MERRLDRIHRALSELIEWHQPTALALEDVYFGRNVRSAMAVGQATGVAMLAAAQRGVRCFTLHAAGDQDGGLRLGLGRQEPGAADGRHAARAARAPRPPTTPPTRSPSRSATAGAPAASGRTRRGGSPAHRSPGRRPAGAAGRMIAAVRGEVLVRRPDHVVVEAAGVGYRLAVSAETLQVGARRPGSEVFLHAELIARDDSLALYGFASEEERDLFRELISVSGVGPKVAIAALSGGAAARAAARDRRRRRKALSGRPGHRQADRRADHRRAAREGRRRARGGAGGRAGADGDPRALARDGLVNLGYAPLGGGGAARAGSRSDDPEELIASALRRAGESRSA